MSELKTREATIGNYGSMDDGFKIKGLKVLSNNEVEFLISPGTIYLRGLSLQKFQEEKFTRQLNWLQKSAYSKPNFNSIEQFDLVFLEVFEKSVSATEDTELLDSAIGIPDSNRNMVVGRVNIAQNIQEISCGKAWNRFTDNIENYIENNSGNIINHELISDARLKVGFIELDEVSDLCSPDAPNGYLGAEKSNHLCSIKG